MSLLAMRQRRIFAGTMGPAIWSASLAHHTWHSVAHGMPVTNDDAACIAAVKKYLGYMPANSDELPPDKPVTDPVDRRDEALLDLQREIDRYRPYLSLSPDEALARAKKAAPAEK